ncbi:MAG TPA: hypothetical protein VFZ27_14405 [Terriglobia bacterium]|nr:hypothetical protein [Terriglobia bacterium]
MRTRKYIVRALIRWVVITGSLAGALFLTAGTTRIPMLRAYIAVFSALLMVTMFVVHPDLARERAQPGAGGADGNLRFASGFFFLVTVGFVAMDVGRLHQSDAVPIPARIIALAAAAAALGFQAWAMIVNPEACSPPGYRLSHPANVAAALSRFSSRGVEAVQEVPRRLGDGNSWPINSVSPVPPRRRAEGLPTSGIPSKTVSTSEAGSGSSSNSSKDSVAGGFGSSRMP